ncbi:MAG: hypothetical protein ACL93V_16720 [Candidatus Electrothrix sp. YB6]
MITTEEKKKKEPANTRETIRFLPFQKPLMQSGNYEITVEQILTSPELSGKVSFSATKKIAVASDRFALPPQDIFAVYPGSGSRKNYAAVLPHIVLTRSTLPWERNFPWLALLLFHEDEPVTPQLMSLQQLQAESNNVSFPKITLEIGQQDDDKITIIDVRRALLEQIMPTAKEVTCLTHVRQRDTAERAVIISNRLPKKAGTSTAYLVSVENRFTEAGTFDYQGAREDDAVRLVVLHSWTIADEQFYRIPEKASDKILSDARQQIGDEIFRGKKAFLEKIATLLPKDKLPLDKITEKKLLHEAIDNTPVFRQFLTDLDSGTFTMPDEKDGEKNRTAQYLTQGFAPLAHHLRNGNTNATWYRGPLLPGRKELRNGSRESSAISGDHLLQYDPEYGMFDVSYAAAWELGQLLCLKSQDVAGALFSMKRGAVQNHLQKKQLKKKKYQHLPLQTGSVSAADTMDRDVADWFARLKHLEFVPFHYLVPREEMLPEESIRFFQVDSFWIDCLLDGALSVGGATPPGSAQKYAELRKQGSLLSGFLLRSELVAIWPDLRIRAEKKKGKRRNRYV